MNRTLPDWYNSYLNYTEEKEPCQLFNAWVAIGTIAAALQRKCYHRMPDGKTFYPNFYIVLIGGSGSRKSTAIEIGEEFLNEIGIELAADVTSKEKLIVRLEQIGNKEEYNPVGALNKISLDMPSEPHSSLTAIADELTVFLPDSDPGFVGYLIKLFDCQSTFKYETKTKGDNFIENVWFNLLGGTTPDQLKRRLSDEVVGTGLTGRMIFVASFDPIKRQAYPEFSKELQLLRRDLIRDLRKIYLLSGPFVPTAGWKELFIPWYEQLDLDPPFQDVNLKPYCSRRGAFIHKLSMIFSASRGDSMKLTASDFKRGLKVMEWAEETMQDAASGIGASATGRVLDDVIIFIRSTKTLKFSALLRRFMYVATTDELSSILGTLKDANRIKMKKVRLKSGGTDALIEYIGDF